jgi:amino acid transporter
VFLERLLLMAEENPNPTVSRWGYVVFDYIGLAFILLAPEEWVRGASLAACIGYLAAGAAFLFLGIMGPRIKEKLLGRRASPKLTAALIISMALTWIAVGYDYYDRHHPSSGYDPNVAWDDKAPLERIFNRKFVNETVVLDGRHFISPVFDNVTLYYEGMGGVFLENPTYLVHDGRLGTRLGSRNKIVTTTMKIEENLFKAGGCPSYNLNLGPDATFDAPK